jgi:hypothetical protein
MSGRNKNRHIGLEEFLRYTQDKMSDRERNAFEKMLQQDPFAAEALEGLSSLAPEEARADLARLEDRLHDRISGRKEASRHTRPILYRIAATVAVLLVVASVLYTIFNDRVGQLDRKVAESPVAEKEEAVPTVPPDVKPQQFSEDITPAQPATRERGTPTPGEEESIRTESGEPETAAVPAEPKVKATGEKTSPVETMAEITAEEDLEEEPAGRELADKAAGQETGIRVAAPVVREEADVAEVAAPAAAMERESAARSRKREAAMPSQKAATTGREERTISGQVISAADKQPLPGAVVGILGRDTGTVTDLNGRFKFSVRDDTVDILIARFIGMEPKEIQVMGDDALIIPMTPDAKYLDQTVIIESGPGPLVRPVGYTTAALAEEDAAQVKKAYHEAMPAVGKVKFDEYIKENLRFPEKEKTLTRAAVILSFIVGPEGRPTQVTVLMSPGKEFSKEAQRLLVSGPDWEPARKNDKYYEQPTRIRILFTKD